MKKSLLILKASNSKSTEEISKKRIWVTPHINNWELVELGNGLGKGADGAVHTYAF
ncbi:hypothetical protein [Aquirufa aurantiipilula]|uniref:Uncharacterized protein n=1 Tax=Aquirufa aurantiipilula TaxID=2696561 RepID=A0ABT6BLK5_9BACT|nr:hypothetical protein [Aquirufa aurantiipilula]MDF5691016.1 hypothetical protein [Aquirufa aurantiipilula]